MGNVNKNVCVGNIRLPIFVLFWIQNKSTHIVHSTEFVEQKIEREPKLKITELCLRSNYKQFEVAGFILDTK